MDSTAARKEASDDLTREYLIGISNSLPDNILGQKCGPDETNSVTDSSKDGKDAEEKRSELISISYDQSPDGQGLVSSGPTTTKCTNKPSPKRDSSTPLSRSVVTASSNELSFRFRVIPNPKPQNSEVLHDMATQATAAAAAAATNAAFKGNLKKAVAGLRRINLDGLRWRVFDAKGQILGRLAAQISTVVQGKDKPTYTPNHDEGDMCVVINAKDICVSGRKLTDKVYYWHTGYVGHLKQRTLKEQMVKDPTEVIRKAVMRMLPRNKLRDDRDRKLRIFAGPDHPFTDKPIEPFVMPPRRVSEMRPRERRALIRAQKKTAEKESGISNYKKKRAEGEAEYETRIPPNITA